MDLKAFPDVVLRAVFDRVPLLDLVRHIPLVCHRWHALQPSVLSGKKSIALAILVGKDTEEIFRGNSNLIIFGDLLTNEDGSQMYPSPMDHHRSALTLRFDTLTPKQTNQLVDKLDGLVTYLDVHFSKTPPVTEAIPLIIQILEHWARTLRTLKLNCSFTDEHEKNKRVLTVTAVLLGQLIASVNTLPLLEHLKLNLDEDLRMVKPLDLPVLGRLKEFYFFSRCGKSHHLFESLKRYAEPNDQLRTIALENSGEMDEYLDQFSRSSLAKRFTVLTQVGYSNLSSFRGRINFRERERFLNTFSNLTTLAIGLKDINLVQLTTTLSPLRHLVQLTLLYEYPVTKFDTVPVDRIRPLPSVKVLELNARTRSHKELPFHHCGRMFPNLQILVIENHTWDCGFCECQRLQMDESEQEKMTLCLAKTLLAFNQQFCSGTLKKVLYSRTDTHVGICPERFY